MYDTFRSNAPAEAWIQRVENVLVPGMPDLFVVHRRRSCWIELKAPTQRARRSSRLLGAEGLNVDQINWHLKAASVGVPSFVLARPDGAHNFLVLLEGAHADEANTMSAEDFDEAGLCFPSWASIWEFIAA